MARGALLCTQARLLANDGLTVIAGKIYEEVLKEDPTESDALLGMGLLLYHEDAARAITWIRRAANVEPTDASRWSQLGTAFYKYGDFPAAIDAFRRAIILDPGATESWLALGDILVARRDAVPAALAYHCATGLSPTQSDAHFRLPSVIMANKPPLRVDALSQLADRSAKTAASFAPYGADSTLKRRVAGSAA